MCMGVTLISINASAIHKANTEACLWAMPLHWSCSEWKRRALSPNRRLTNSISGPESMQRCSGRWRRGGKRKRRPKSWRVSVCERRKAGGKSRAMTLRARPQIPKPTLITSGVQTHSYSSGRAGRRRDRCSPALGSACSERPSLFISGDATDVLPLQEPFRRNQDRF